MGKCPRRTVPRTRPCPSSWVSSGQGGRCMWIGPRVGKALRRSQETWSAVVVPLPSWILRACPRPSLSLSCVTLEWEVLIFDPQESVQFRDLRLYHPDASQTHTRLVPKPQAEGPAPSSLCGSTSQPAWSGEPSGCFPRPLPRVLSSRAELSPALSTASRSWPCRCSW